MLQNNHPLGCLNSTQQFLSYYFRYKTHNELKRAQSYKVFHAPIGPINNILKFVSTVLKLSDIVSCEVSCIKLPQGVRLIKF